MGLTAGLRSGDFDTAVHKDSEEYVSVEAVIPFADAGMSGHGVMLKLSDGSNFDITVSERTGRPGRSAGVGPLGDKLRKADKESRASPSRSRTR